jgi:hypothetical protein
MALPNKVVITDKIQDAFKKVNQTIDNLITGVTYNNISKELSLKKYDGTEIQTTINPSGLINNVYVYESFIGFVNADTYISLDETININNNNGTYYKLIINSGNTTTGNILAYNINVDLTNAVNGNSIIIELDTNGNGLSTLNISSNTISATTEYLSNGFTYLLTYSSTNIRGKYYVLNKISENNFSKIGNTVNAFKIGAGKTLLSNSRTYSSIDFENNIPIGEEITLILDNGSTISAIGASIINPPSTPINGPQILRFIKTPSYWIYG